MTTRNDITGDAIRTGMPDNYNNIDFTRKNESWAETAKRLKEAQKEKGVYQDVGSRKL